MSHLKKVMVTCLAVLFTVTTIPGVALALPEKLYQTSYQETITAGATLEHISRFTADGWLNIKVLRVDTGNPNIKIDALANSQISDKLSTLPALVEKTGAVAAVNASFYNIMDKGTGYPDGPFVLSGDLLSTSGWYNQTKDEMASFSLNNAGQMIFHYWKNDLTLAGSDQVTFAVSQYNQPSREQYNDITVLDQKWGSSTVGASKEFPDLVEILVSQGSVQEIRMAQPATTIPANGFVVVSRGAQAAKLLNGFRVGSPIKLNITSNPDWAGLQMSVTGSSILVKDGKIPEKFSFSTGSFDKRNPRTLVGSSRDGKQMILVTVDGRQDNSIGLTQTEAAELMQELGAYNALILDGGGSTTMVTRDPGTTSADVVNIPSEGALRSVANGIGIFSLASPGSLNKLMLETDDTNVFVNTSRKITLKGVDSNFNPVEIDPKQVQWSVSGVKGTFSGSQFRPSSAGSGKVTAKVGNLTATINIRSLSAPVKLSLDTKQLEVPLGQSRKLQVTGYDIEGFSALIEPENVQWKVNGKIGSCQNGTFSASAIGSGFIDAAVGSVHAYTGVSVYTDFTENKNLFEEKNADILAQSQAGRGSFEISNKNVHEGNNSGELTYDFFASGDLAEVSLVFRDKGISLHPGTSSLSLWLYNTHENSNKIWGEIMDASGKKHQIQFSSDLEWSGWKQLKVSLEEFKAPAYLTRIYIQNVDTSESFGKIFVDDLKAEVVNHPAIDQSKIPLDTAPKDEANRQVSYAPGQNNFKFSVFGSREEPESLQEKQLINKMTAYINKNLDLAVYTGVKAAPASKDLKKPALITGTGYKTYSYKNSTFIQLDISKGGLRRSDPKQWTWLFEELEKISGNNAFIVMSDTTANFINAKEAGLLKDTLADFRNKTGKNVWVLYQGSENRSELDRGVKYISCAGLETADPSKGKPVSAKYLQVTVQGKKITYEFKSL
ncbi:MAG: phosphodiester glycosidase family protein [Peptococcaceae bacterium]|nr:phosphodiester glycosidase family protein [Peptococcaceae bacterium]